LPSNGTKNTKIVVEVKRHRNLTASIAFILAPAGTKCKLYADFRQYFLSFCANTDTYKHRLIMDCINAVTNKIPSNLMKTTSECVHLVTRGHFLSCHVSDKDGGHYTIFHPP